MLTQFEKKEVLKYSEIYYLGKPEAKEQTSFKSILNARSNSMSHSYQNSNNNGFDRQNGFYRVIIGDHIAYRYEILKELDRGAFGQVVRCIDHKTQREVAVKINKYV
jgi:dual specificity tyrosine-phosphorylation-regulated kinase 2/3/4